MYFKHLLQVLGTAVENVAIETPSVRTTHAPVMMVTMEMVLTHVYVRIVWLFTPV